jgi:DNA-binding NarL/FixJ family response regulator
VARTSPPILIALIDDYDVVLTGIASMLDPYRDRVLVAEIDANEPLVDTVDIALYDSFAQPEADHNQIEVLVGSQHAKRVVVYTWNFHPDLIASARRQGAHGYLSKTLPARELVQALEAVHAGEEVISDPPIRAARPSNGLDWPGRREGLTDREAEILALITQGHSNAEVAATTFLSPNTVKSYIRGLYRKIGATSRTQAVLWGINHGFTPDHHRIDHWRGGP